MTARLPSRLFLADHMLRNAAGHHLGYNLALADAADRAGAPAQFVTHRAFDLTLAEGVPCHRIFHTDFRAAPPPWIARNHRLLTLLEKWCDHRFGEDLRRFPEVNPSDAVFAQMLAPRHFVHWLKWMGSRPTPPVLFLHLGYRPGRFETPVVTSALQRFLPRFNDRIYFLTDSEKMSVAFGRILNAEVHYLPHIISYELPRPSVRPITKPLVVFAPGNARREKGFAETVQAAEAIARSDTGGDFHFVIQCHDPDPDCAKILRSDGIGIEWITRPLGNAEYAKRLSAADIILLPYHLDCYELRTSGVFCEARVAGKPVIASKNSWAGDRIRRGGGGWLVDERDAASLIDVLRSVPAGFAQKSAEAIAASAQARVEFSRDEFLSGLTRLYSHADS